MGIERKPGMRRPNAFEARVYPYVLRGDSRQTIADETGIIGSRLTDTIKRVRAKYLGKLTPEEQMLMHRQNTSARRGGILLAVSEYFPLDLTSRQTQIALEVDHGISLPQPKIAHAYAREMHRHGLQRPIEELTIEAQRDKRRSPEELLDIARSRSAAHEQVLANHWNKPETLSDWKFVEGGLSEEEYSLLPQTLDNPELVPVDTLGRRYLLDLIRARSVFLKSGDFSYLANFPPAYRKIDPAIFDRLHKQRKIVHLKTAFH